MWQTSTRTKASSQRRCAKCSYGLRAQVLEKSSEWFDIQKSQKTFFFVLFSVNGMLFTCCMSGIFSRLGIKSGLCVHVLCCIEVCVCVFQLLAVVSELERQGLNILVLGRKHMLRPSRSWDRRNMDLIRQKAQCFFTENMWAEKKQTKQTGWWYCDLRGRICVFSINNFFRLSVRRTIPSCCTPLCTLGITVASWAGTWWGTTGRACRTEPPDGSSSNGSEVTSWSWTDTWQRAGESNFWWGGGEADTRRKGCQIGDLTLTVCVCVCVFRVSPATTPSSRRQLTRGTSHMTTRMTGAPTKYRNGGFASPESAERSHSLALTVDLKM